jgi:hypothetical protein
VMNHLHFRSYMDQSTFGRMDNAWLGLHPRGCNRQLLAFGVEVNECPSNRLVVTRQQPPRDFVAKPKAFNMQKLIFDWVLKWRPRFSTTNCHVTDP